MFTRNPMKSVLTALAVGALFAFSSPGAYAANLDLAKTQGMVCELPTGYLQATGSATGDVRAMVSDINAKRKAEYSRIADQNGVAPGQVGKLTAQKLNPKCK